MLQAADGQPHPGSWVAARGAPSQGKGQQPHLRSHLRNDAVAPLPPEMLAAAVAAAGINHDRLKDELRYVRAHVGDKLVQAVLSPNPDPRTLRHVGKEAERTPPAYVVEPRPSQRGTWSRRLLACPPSA